MYTTKLQLTLIILLLLASGVFMTTTADAQNVHALLVIMDADRSIGPEMKFTAWPKNLLNPLQHALIQNSTLSMASFPPRIGEVDMHLLERVFHSVLLNKSLAITLEHDGVGKIATR